MRNYEIINTISGSSLGVYQADDEQGALDAMARGAGFSDHGAACEEFPVAPGELLVREVEASAQAGEGSMGRSRTYAERIVQASDRFEAADLVRAMACFCAAHVHRSDAERLDIVDRYERHAQTLERDFAEDEDSDPMTEDEHPWREWLREWGYITGWVEAP